MLASVDEISVSGDMFGSLFLPVSNVWLLVAVKKKSYPAVTRPLSLLTDIDECANPETSNCGTNAECSNTEGSYTCSCRVGFTGDGKNCAGNLIVEFAVMYFCSRKRSAKGKFTAENIFSQNFRP